HRGGEPPMRIDVDRKRWADSVANRADEAGGFVDIASAGEHPDIAERVDLEPAMTPSGDVPGERREPVRRPLGLVPAVRIDGNPVTEGAAKQSVHRYPACLAGDVKTGVEDPGGAGEPDDVARHEVVLDDRLPDSCRRQRVEADEQVA